MEVKEKKMNIREWELQFPKAFLSIQGRGRGFIEIPIPRELKVGEHVYIRDIHFPYKNDYARIMPCVLKRNIGTHESPVRFEVERKETTQGTVYFIDKMFRPAYQNQYLINLPMIPVIPQGYGLFYRVHYRYISRNELERFESSVLDFFMSRKIEL